MRSAFGRVPGWAAVQLVLGLALLAICGPSEMPPEGRTPGSVGGADLERAGRVLAERIVRLELETVAVVDLNDLAGRTTELGRVLAEELAVVLVAEADRYRVVDRSHLAQILTEHRLTTTGLITQETVREVGRVSGVDALVTGTIAPVGGRLEVTWKVIATATAAVLASERTWVERSPTVDELARRPTVGGFGTPVSSPAATLSRAAADLAVAPRQVVEVRDFSVALHRCRRESAGIACAFTVANRGRERNFHLLFTATRLIDPAGATYRATDMVLGARTASGAGRLSSPAIPGQPVQAQVLFELPGPEVTEAARVELDSWGFEVVFHRVAID